MARLGWFAAAAVAGLVHAAASAYWAVGGTWLIDTVGRDARELSQRHPLAAGVALGVVAVAKIAGAVVPLLVERGRIPGRRWWRSAEWIGAGALAAYGLVNTIGATLLLTGVVTRPRDFDRAGTIGHAALWDPLFFAWGALLLLGLWATRRKAAPGRGEL